MSYGTWEWEQPKNHPIDIICKAYREVAPSSGLSYYQHFDTARGALRVANALDKWAAAKVVGAAGR